MIIIKINEIVKIIKEMTNKPFFFIFFFIYFFGQCLLPQLLDCSAIPQQELALEKRVEYSLLSGIVIAKCPKE